MWKQDYYPPFEDSEYLGAQHNWRYAFSASVITMLIGLASAYYIIDANDGFNRPFGEPARTLRGTPFLTNSSTITSVKPVFSNVIEVKGLDVFAVTKEPSQSSAKIVKAKSVRKAVPVSEPIKDVPASFPEVHEPVTAPRIIP